jgi:hypothetical protein
MATTTRLALPLIDGTQAQKHVTHNEALALVDLIIHCRIADRDLAAPPASPSAGAAYIVAAAPTGAWAGRAGQVACWLDGGWTFLQPVAGWLAWVADEARLFVHTGSGWVDLVASLQSVPSSLDNLAHLGVGTTADASNPLSAKLNAALFTAKYVAEGGTGDLRYTLNKEAAARTATLLMQSNWSGRAEIGLAGDDNLALKVSSDGATWRTALKITGASGQVATMALVPAADNTHALGGSGARWTQLFAATATINTSDAATKTDIAADVPGLDFVRALRPVTYRQIATDGGREGRRSHCGFVAQEVRAALPRDLALWTEDRDSGLQGLRYEEFVPVLARAIQQLADRIDAMA